MSRVYWDSMLFVYLIEDNKQYRPRVEQILGGIHKRRDTLCTSVFTVGEVLAGPYKRKAKDVVEQIEDAFRSSALELLPFSLETAKRYAEIRAQTRVSPADAIHLASAAQAGVNLFLTNDGALRGLVIPGIDFIADLNVNLF